MTPTEIATLILGGGGAAAVAAAIGKIGSAIIGSRDKNLSDDRLAKQQERQDAAGAMFALVTELQGIAKDERNRGLAEAKRAGDATDEHRNCLQKVKVLQDQMQEERQACRDEIEEVRSSLQTEINALRSEFRNETSPPPAAQ
jgi:hypothetical protein